MNFNGTPLTTPMETTSSYGSGSGSATAAPKKTSIKCQKGMKATAHTKTDTKAKTVFASWPKGPYPSPFATHTPVVCGPMGQQIPQQPIPTYLHLNAAGDVLKEDLLQESHIRSAANAVNSLSKGKLKPGRYPPWQYTDNKIEELKRARREALDREFESKASASATMFEIQLDDTTRVQSVYYKGDIPELDDFFFPKQKLPYWD